MQLRDTVSLAYRTIRGNKLRTGITVAIIAFGIMALVGIVTAIEALKQKFTESFSSMGANGFSIRYKDRQMRFGGNNQSDVKKVKKGLKEKKSNMGRFITWDEAVQFKQRYQYPALVSISTSADNNSIASYQSIKTNPNVRVIGTDDNFINLNAYNINLGRNFSKMDIESGRSVCVLGMDVANKLFKNRPKSAVDKIIRINNNPYRVIAVLDSKGSTFGFSRDNLIVIAYSNTRRFFSNTRSYTINIKVNNISQLEEAIGEATGVFRPIRKTTTIEDNNFVVDKSDSFAEKALNSLRYFSVGAIVIGIITLIGAAIALMNIMLVAVTERTKEVGLVKAIGGKRGTVRRQFLYESLLISLLGASFGIVLGIIIGNLFSLVLSTGFVLPWNWVFLGIAICTVVGLVAGIYPAWKASKLNPIEALRYE
jgi:putative ABC transport system permease protein